MAQVELLLPKMGESVAEATILKWLKKPGDKIAVDENVLEIATDKVDSEVPSSVSGTLVKQFFAEGQVVKVGAVIALIETSASATVVSEPSKPAPLAEIQKPQAVVTPSRPVASSSNNSPVEVQRVSSSGKFYSPLVRSIAKSEGVSMEELESISGSGKDGRVTKDDVLAYLPKRNEQESPSPTLPEGKGVAYSKEYDVNIVIPKIEYSAPVAEPPQLKAQPAVSFTGEAEIIEMDRMRKLIADHMVMSKHTSPHVTSYVEADVTNIVTWRDKVKGDFEKREKEKITFTPIFIEAIARAIKDFPMINVSVEGTKIIVKKNINIGVAVALPTGNLIVPVIKKADYMNLVGLTKTVNDFATRARAGRLVPDDIQGGTFTLTNVGSFGNLMGTPIINQPQVAILAVGAIKKKPAVIETPSGDTIGIRQMMFLSLSYDHRVVDGSLGGSFLRRIADYLEGFDANRSF